MLQIRDPDRFQKIAAGIQSLLVSIALLVGGGWTLYAFTSQLQIENSRAQLAKLKRELSESPRLELDLTVSSLSVSRSSKHRYFECRLTVKNVGTKSTVMKFSEKSIVLSQVKLLGRGELQWKIAQNLVVPTLGVDGAQSDLASLVVHPGTKNEATWVIEIDSPGLYVLGVQSERSRSETKEAQDAGIPESNVVWGTNRYFLVE